MYLAKSSNPSTLIGGSVQGLPSFSTECVYKTGIFLFYYFILFFIIVSFAFDSKHFYMYITHFTTHTSRNDKTSENIVFKYPLCVLNIYK